MGLGARRRAIPSSPSVAAAGCLHDARGIIRGVVCLQEHVVAEIVSDGLCNREKAPTWSSARGPTHVHIAGICAKLALRRRAGVVARRGKTSEPGQACLSCSS